MENGKDTKKRKQQELLFTLSPEEYKVGNVVNYYCLEMIANQQIVDENNQRWLERDHQNLVQYLHHSSSMFQYEARMVE